MDLPFDRFLASTGGSAVRSHSLHRLMLVTLVVTVQVLLVLVVVASSLGVGHETPAGVGPDRPPSPQPAGAAVPRVVQGGAGQAVGPGGAERSLIVL
jgi:hypothetical protein